MFPIVARNLVDGVERGEMFFEPLGDDNSAGGWRTGSADSWENFKTLSATLLREMNCRNRTHGTQTGHTFRGKRLDIGSFGKLHCTKQPQKRKQEMKGLLCQK
jgi:hypothetical protein